jgi:hypothetical protein
VLASYCDALGVRAFADGKDLAADLAERKCSAMIDALCDKPLINIESAINHPCQALADWRTLDELGVPQRAKFVLSWAGIRARCRWRCPRRRCTWPRCAAWKWWCCARKASRCRRRSWTRRGARAAAAGGSVRETAIAPRRWPARTCSMPRNGAHQPYGDAGRRMRARAGLVDWCVRESWFAGARPMPLMHCLPVRRNVASPMSAGRPRARGQARGLQSTGGGRWPFCTACWPDRPPCHGVTDMIKSRPTLPRRARAAQAPPYIRMYKNKVFVIKAGGAVFATKRPRAR